MAFNSHPVPGGSKAELIILIFRRGNEHLERPRGRSGLHKGDGGKAGVRKQEPSRPVCFSCGSRQGTWEKPRLGFAFNMATNESEGITKQGKTRLECINK
jgi:hypothetical protein